MPSVLSKLQNALLMPEWSLPYNCYETGHTWNPSCTVSALDISGHVFKEALVMYSGLYMASQALFQRKFDPQTTSKTIKSILTSSTFLGLNGFFMIALGCGLRKLSSRFYYTIYAFLPATIGSYLAIFIERPARRSVLAFYCANIASECLYRISVTKGYLKPIPHGEILLFSLSMSLLLYMIRLNGYGKDPVSFALKLVLGREEAKRRENKGTLTTVKRMVDQENNVIDLVTRGEATESTVLEEKTEEEVVHSLCPHKGLTCQEYAFQGFIRPLVLGWVGQTLLRTFSRPLKFIRDPLTLLKNFVDFRTMQFGLFLGSFGLVFKGSNCGLRRLRGGSSNIDALISGFLAGPTMFICPSTTIATYVLWKCIETYHGQLEAAGKIPYPNQFIALLYAVSVNTIFYTGVLEPLCVRPSYLRFIDELTNHKLHQFNRGILTVFGTNAAEGYEGLSPNLSPEFCSRQYLETVFTWML